MSLEFSPEIEKIMDTLPGVQVELQATEAALRTTEQELGRLSNSHTALITGHETAVADLTKAHSRAVLNTYDRRLQKAMTIVATDAENPFGLPSPEICEQVAQLDELISAAAGQPIIVTKPGEGWFDVGMLAAADADRPEQTGLQVAYGHIEGKLIVELPMNHIPLAVDSKTGQEPRSTQSRYGDLMKRVFKHPGTTGEMIRPAIDPLNTRVVVSDVSPMIAGNTVLTEITGSAGTEIMKVVGQYEQAETEPETTYILIGYTALHGVFNIILGFEDDEESLEGYVRFRHANEAQQRFEEVGISFDADAINGVLAHKIAAWERNTKQQPTGIYEAAQLAALKSKQTRLLEAGLITA
jgi:hypothetical protein